MQKSLCGVEVKQSSLWLHVRRCLKSSSSVCYWPQSWTLALLTQVHSLRLFLGGREGGKVCLIIHQIWKMYSTVSPCWTRFRCARSLHLHESVKYPSNCWTWLWLTIVHSELAKSCSGCAQPPPRGRGVQWTPPVCCSCMWALSPSRSRAVTMCPKVWCDTLKRPSNTTVIAQNLNFSPKIGVVLYSQSPYSLANMAYKMQIKSN